MARLKDIAELAGVDISTASKVLQGREIRVAPATRERIEAAAKELHYRPSAIARSLRSRRSGALALALPSTTNYLYPEIVNGAEEAAEEGDYCLFLVKYSARDAGESLISLVEEGRIEGLMLADDLPSPSFAGDLDDRGIAYVTLNRQREGPGRYVALDDDAGFGLQARFLVETGHREVAFVATSSPSFITNLCLEAFLRVCGAAAPTMPDPLKFSCDFEGLGADRVADEIASLSNRPTAVACASVLVASRLIDSLRRRGLRVPGDVSVIGYHDSQSAAASEITTVVMPSRAQGKLGLQRLIQIVSGESFDGEIVQELPQIAIRSTCRRLP